MSPMTSTPKVEASVCDRSSSESVTTTMKGSSRAWTGMAKTLSDSSSNWSPGRSTKISPTAASRSCSGVSSRTSAYAVAATTPPVGVRIWAMVSSGSSCSAAAVGSEEIGSRISRPLS